MPEVPDTVPPAAPPSTNSGAPAARPVAGAVALPPEIGGPPGPEPTRYGDWEKQGRCIDF